MAMMENKILLVNKEENMTSRDVVNKLIPIFKTKKIGHTGTLDPMAKGVLVVVINEATKLCDLLTSTKKEYIAQIKLGIKTDTKDITGNIEQEQKVRKYSVDEIKSALNSFLGTSYQEVPKYSAVKINGKKLYEYARNNIEIELPKRQIHIYAIELIEYNDNIITFKAEVSKGTYIRSLVEDIAAKLDTIGTMSSLIRTKQGDFTIENSYTLDEIKNNNYQYLTLKEALKNYKQIDINGVEYNKIKNGAIIDKKYQDDIIVFIYNNKVVGIYKTYDKDQTKMKPYKIFNN